MPLHKSGLSTRGPCVNMQTPSPPRSPTDSTGHCSLVTGHWSLVAGLFVVEANTSRSGYSLHCCLRPSGAANRRLNLPVAGWVSSEAP